MAKPKEKSLFDNQDEVLTNSPAEIPFEVALLALGSIRGLGQKGLQALVDHFEDNLGSVFAQPHEDIKQFLFERKISNSNKIALTIKHSPEDLLKKGKAILAELEAKDVQVIPPSCLPDRFRALKAEAPKWLFVQGDATLLESRPVVAVVGTRKPTDLGQQAAAAISYILSAYPVLVVSGLADGIDAEAHASSLKRGLKNIAFLGHGINLIFPQETAILRTKIIRQGGAVVSEYMPHQTYQKRQFVERNRLQAALADIVIPVEANSASGTAHTARFARKYGRPIIGVRWKGSNGLVDDLAKEGDRIIDILTAEGQKELDSVIRKLVEESNGKAYPFLPLERQIARELQSRTYSPEDVEKLVEAIRKMGEESSKNG